MPNKTAPAADILTEKLEKLASWLNQSGLEEVEIESEGTRIRLRKGWAATSAVLAPAGAVAAAATAPVPAAPAADLSAQTFTSPMVGTFYTASGPEAQPFVKIGDSVQTGQTLCIIEAMKTMNSIASDRAGIVKAIKVQNAQPVEFGQALFIIE